VAAICCWHSGNRRITFFELNGDEMSKIAFMTLLDREDSALSPHFGKAKWMLIRDTEQGTSHFIQNHGLNGKSVVEQLLREGCSDVITSGIGQGAVENLTRANVRGWLAPAGVPALQLVEMLAGGSLQPVHATQTHGDHGGCAHGDGEKQDGGCGCQHRHDGGESSGGCCCG
jgi:predicted Fe-Mo cluster-binding NifX family protein